MSPSPVNRVLLVDDEPNLVDLFELWLAEDYETVTATSGNAAIEKFTPSIDAVFLDRDLPTMEGTDLATEIRNQEADIPIAFVSGKKPDDEALKTDFEDYLVKPVQKQGLLSALDFFEILTQLEDPRRRYVKTLRKQAVIHNTKGRISKKRMDELQSIIESCRADVDEIPNELKDLDKIRLAEPSKKSAIMKPTTEPKS